MDAVVSEIAGKQIQIPANGLRGIVATPIVTPVPLAPPEVRGVAQLAGEIIPVLDLGVALQMRAMPATPAERLLDAEISDTRVLVDVGHILDDGAAASARATPHIIVDLEIVLRDCSRRCGSGADSANRP
jgi:CheW-like protein